MSYREVPRVKQRATVFRPAGGEPGELVWLHLERLLVDGRYQRELGSAGEARVRKMAENFDWRRFTPIIVAPAEGHGGDRLAVIDGQHRCAAALARGLDKVPAWIIGADVGEQARAFMAINAGTAKVAEYSLWYARRAAGDADAHLLFALCDRANVVICRYPKPSSVRAANETLSPTAIHIARIAVGEAAVVRALSVLRRAGEIAERSLIVQIAIRALTRIAREDRWQDGQIETLAQRLALLDLGKIDARAAIAAAKDGGTRAEHILRLIRRHLEERAAA